MIREGLRARIEKAPTVVRMCSNYSGDSNSVGKAASHQGRTGGRTDRTVGTTYYHSVGAMLAPGGEVNYGIVVGIGTNAVTTGDYTVQTPIAHGSGAGQLNYGATASGGAVDAGGGCTLTVSRQFGNASGGSITIREVCLCCQHSSFYFLLSRDIVTQAIANGNTATAIIEVSTVL